MNDIPSDRLFPEDLEDWILPSDKAPLLLAITLYQGTPRQTLITDDGYYQVIQQTIKPRTCAWMNQMTRGCVIALRGTTFGKKESSKDAEDDAKISGLSRGGYCDLSLVREGQALVNELKYQVSSITFVGHSLGGTAAFCLTQANENTFGIAFNGGAAPTNPILSGPGPERFRFYHIFGDIISSHMSPDAAALVRVRYEGLGFGDLETHYTSMMVKRGRPWSSSTADEEDDAWRKFGMRNLPGIFRLIGNLFGFANFLFKLVKSGVAAKSPIPGSKRFDRQRYRGGSAILFS